MTVTWRSPGLRPVPIEPADVQASGARRHAHRSVRVPRFVRGRVGGVAGVRERVSAGVFVRRHGCSWGAGGGRGAAGHRAARVIARRCGSPTPTPTSSPSSTRAPTWCGPPVTRCSSAAGTVPRLRHGRRRPASAGAGHRALVYWAAPGGRGAGGRRWPRRPRCWTPTRSQLEHLLVSDTLFMFLIVLAVALCLANAAVASRHDRPAAGRRHAHQDRRPAADPAPGGLVPCCAGHGRAGPPGCCSRRRWCPWSPTAPGSTPPTSASASSARTASSCTPRRCRSRTAPGWIRRPTCAVLCDPRPPGQRPPSQEYIWAKDAPLVALPGITFTRETDDLAGRFAALAIRTQPLDYAGSVASELGRSFVWGRPVYPDQEIYDYYQFPVTPPGPPGRYAAHSAPTIRSATSGADRHPVVEPYAGWMRTYQDVARLPGTVLLASCSSRAGGIASCTAGGGLPAGCRRGPSTARPVAAAVDDGGGAVGHPAGGRGVRLPLRPAGRAAGLPGCGAGCGKP